MKYPLKEVLMNNERKAYEEKLEAQLKERIAQIDLLRAKAEDAKADAKINYYNTIKALEGKLDAARAKLHELKDSGDEAWDAVKTGVEKTWTEAKAAFHEATSKFK
jgi:hypothetical protein